MVRIEASNAGAVHRLNEQDRYQVARGRAGHAEATETGLGCGKEDSD
jgi:hypothetical protein